MRWILGILVLTAAPLVAQTAPGDSQPATPIVIPDGVRISAALLTGIDAEHSKPGTPVTLETTANVRGRGGKVLIPEHAKLSGRVTEAIPWTKAKPESRLSIVVEHAEWKGGTAVMKAFIVGKLKVLIENPGVGSGAIAAVQVPGPGDLSAVPPGAGPRPDYEHTQDPTAKLQVAGDSTLASEVVSTKHTVHMERNSTFDLLNAPNQ